MPPLPPTSSSAAAEDETDEGEHERRGTRTPPGWPSQAAADWRSHEQQSPLAGVGGDGGSSKQPHHHRHHPHEQTLPRQRIVQSLVETHPAVQSFGQAAAGMAGQLHAQQQDPARPISGLPGSSAGRSPSSNQQQHEQRQPATATPTTFLSPSAEQQADSNRPSPSAPAAGSSSSPTSPSKQQQQQERPPLKPASSSSISGSSSFPSRPSSPPRRPSEIEREMELLRSRVGQLQMSAQRGLGRVQDELRQQQQESRRRAGTAAGGGKDGLDGAGWSDAARQPPMGQDERQSASGSMGSSPAAGGHQG